MINYFIFTAAAALPAPIELFSAAVFNIGDLVQSTPDTTPGMHPSSSVSFAGTVSELKLDGGWYYNISSTSTDGSIIFIHYIYPCLLQGHAV